MAFEGGARRVLMLHDSGEYESGCEGDGKGVGDGLVVLLECVFFHVELQLVVEILEEDPPEMVTLLYYDGVLVAQV